MLFLQILSGENDRRDRGADNVYVWKCEYLVKYQNSANVQLVIEIQFPSQIGNSQFCSEARVQFVFGQKLAVNIQLTFALRIAAIAEALLK